ncbi:MAG: phospholipase D-like domain-containing protein [Myxococcota bacterium]
MRWKLLLIAALAATLAACGPAEEQIHSPDARDASALPNGKADSPYSACQLEHAVLWLNDGATADDLQDAGVHSRGANNIIEYRNGADGAFGTDDDQYFADAVEIDDVYYVGPVAMGQLTAAVSDYCDPAPTRSAETIFSPQPYHESHLARVKELIDGAETSLDIAMYSFRDQGIMQAVEDAVDRGVEVRMLFQGAYDDRSEPSGSTSAKLEDMGVDVRWVNKIMHHKFVLVDGPKDSLMQAPRATLATGSGNWSYSAGTRYDENTVILQGDTETNLRFQKEFNYLWEWSRDFEWNGTKTKETSTEIADGMVYDVEGVDAAFTSMNFRTYVSSRYGNTFGIVRGRDTVSDRIVALIEEADESLWVASGHLRSRPISEAILAKAEANPEMDIRVYLDGQEFISEGYHGYQEWELEQCLEDAGDSDAQRQDCIDSGFYFSYPMYEAGIPTRFKFYSYRWHYTYAVQMHHKYLILDGDTVISGSYNLSDNAEHNTMENIVIYHRTEYPALVDEFVANFESIWDTGRAEGVYEALVSKIETAEDSIPIVFESMALTYEEVDALKDLIRQTCPAVESEDFEDDPENHERCQL